MNKCESALLLRNTALQVPAVNCTDFFPLFCIRDLPNYHKTIWLVCKQTYFLDSVVKFLIIESPSVYRNFCLFVYFNNMGGRR